MSLLVVDVFSMCSHRGQQAEETLERVTVTGGKQKHQELDGALLVWVIQHCRKSHPIYVIENTTNTIMVPFCCMCACAAHIMCWWRLCRVLLSAVGQASLWGTLLAVQLHHGRCADHPNVRPTPDQTLHEAGRNMTQINTANVTWLLIYFIWMQGEEYAFKVLNLTRRTLFLELPTRKMPTVCKPTQDIFS